MKSNLAFVHEGLEHYDSDGERSLFMYNNPSARIQLITELISYSVSRMEGKYNPVEIKQRTEEIMRWLDGNYHGYEWCAHETHFHTSFAGFASCPFTCLNEISTTIEKLIKEKFAA